MPAALLAVPQLHAANDPDKRLATMKRAYVLPVDYLAEDKPTAVCLARHLADQTPLALAATKEEADAVFKVSGHLRSRSPTP